MITLSPEMAGLVVPVMALLVGALLSGMALYTHRHAHPREKGRPSE